MKSVCTTCPYCGVGCGLLADINGTIKGDPEHPANFGRLCSKGAALGETIDLEGRLLTPRIHGKPANWDEALDLVARKFSVAIEEHGPDSVAFYVSGQLLSEDYYVANKLMKGFIGSANIDTNSRLCMASSVAGHKRSFGSDTVPAIYEDLEQADLVVLVGSNLAWCHPVLFQRLMAAKSSRPTMKVITIDPRRTATSAASDLHLSIHPDGDIALFNGLLAQIGKRGAIDRKYVAAHVEGFEKTMETAVVSDPSDIGLTKEQIDEFYDIWIASEKVVTVYSQGVNQSTCGTDKVNAIINCHLATGRIGRSGMGPFSMTGQPNAMGGREVGGLANMLACHLDIENPTHRDVVQKAWQSPTICTKPGLKAVDLFAACKEGKIKALWIMGTNPAVSMPDIEGVRQAISSVDFCVASEVLQKTDTSELSHVQLPATAWGEKNGMVTNSERRISRQRAFLPAPGKTRPDWKIICDVAQRMGWKKYFSYDGPAQIFREYAHLSGHAAKLGGDFDISGLAHINDEEYESFKPVQWPVKNNGMTGGRFFAGGGFFHEDGKARMLPVRSPSPARNSDGSFHLNTGRVRDHWHTMTRTAKSPRLSQHMVEPFAQIHLDDAKKLGVLDGELLEIHGNDSRIVVRADMTADIQPGTVFVPMHWSQQNSSGGLVNTLVKSKCDPFSAQPALKGGRVEVAPFKARWYGFAASAEIMEPHCSYGVVARSKTGWSMELAGVDPVHDWEQEARNILNLKSGNSSMLYDRTMGIVRIAVHRGKILKGIFFAGPKPISLDRSHIVSQINQPLPAFAALAGTPRSGRPDPGRILCACFDVGINTVRAAINAGSNSVIALGKNTLAGTNCGSCKTELQALINTEKLSNAEQ